MGFVSRSQTLGQLAPGRNVATTMRKKNVVKVHRCMHDLEKFEIGTIESWKR